ncbi:hypothetical protein [Mycobacterium lepromatosis]|uniref:hypothetical protein n=1 Tax=Mycobacterium lepromatosis TaxID=480418 RepID=UPI0006796DD5|nr:hypothetical protein [Mycobacterium lepromatosis]
MQLVKTRDVENVLGWNRTDKLDAVWLAKLTEKGLLGSVFVPSAKFYPLLLYYTRLWVDLTRDYTCYWQRLEKTVRGRAGQNIVGGLNPDHAVHTGHDRGPDC